MDFVGLASCGRANVPRALPHGSHLARERGVHGYRRSGNEKRGPREDLMDKAMEIGTVQADDPLARQRSTTTSIPRRVSLFGAAKPVHIPAPTSTARGMANVVALACAEAAVEGGGMAARQVGAHHGQPADGVSLFRGDPLYDDRLPAQEAGRCPRRSGRRAAYLRERGRGSGARLREIGDGN